MKNNTSMCYSKIHLRNRLRIFNAKSEAESKQLAKHISLIAETINNNKEYQYTDITEGKTKEQLFTLGLSVSQVQQYFEYRNCSSNSSYMRWFLKSYLIINGHKIRTIKDLIKVLEANSLKVAS